MELLNTSVSGCTQILVHDPGASVGSEIQAASRRSWVTLPMPKSVPHQQAGRAMVAA
jgi:hypothetical protein